MNDNDSANADCEILRGRTGSKDGLDIELMKLFAQHPGVKYEDGQTVLPILQCLLPRLLW